MSCISRVVTAHLGAGLHPQSNRHPGSAPSRSSLVGQRSSLLLTDRLFEHARPALLRPRPVGLVTFCGVFICGAGGTAISWTFVLAAGHRPAVTSRTTAAGIVALRPVDASINTTKLVWQ